MIWSVLALVSLVALGGFIAYYGDVQGTRWGKRRARLFGLRPKHTAMLITSLTGAFIVLLSVATLLIISPTVREVVLSGERLIRENRRLLASQKADTRKFGAQIRDLNDQIRALEARQAGVKSEYDRVCKELGQIQQQKEALEQHNERLEAKQTELEKSKARLETTLNREQKTLSRLRLAQRQMQTWNKEASSLNKQLSAQNDQYARDNIELEKLKVELEEANARLTSGNTELKVEEERLKAIRDQLKEIVAARQKENDTLFQANIELETKVRELTEKQEQLYTQLAGVGRTFTQTFTELRQGQLIVTVGELLGRRQLEANTTPMKARAQLLELLDDASRVALQRGATKGDNGRAVRIVSKRIVSPTGEQAADETASLDALVDNLARQERPRVVLVNALNNSIQGEQVVVEISFRDLTQVFRKGEPVASQTIDAGQPPEKVEYALLEFLQSDVRAAAIRAGSVPQIDRETGAKSLGAFSASQLVSLAQRVRRMGGQVIVTACARQRTSSTDPLLLDFKLARPLVKTGRTSP